MDAITSAALAIYSDIYRNPSSAGTMVLTTLIVGKTLHKKSEGIARTFWMTLVPIYALFVKQISGNLLAAQIMLMLSPVGLQSVMSLWTNTESDKRKVDYLVGSIATGNPTMDEFLQMYDSLFPRNVIYDTLKSPAVYMDGSELHATIPDFK